MKRAMFAGRQGGATVVGFGEIAAVESAGCYGEKAQDAGAGVGELDGLCGSRNAYIPFAEIQACGG